MKNIVKLSFLALAAVSLAGTSFADSVSPRSSAAESHTVAIFAAGQGAGGNCCGKSCSMHSVVQKQADAQANFRETGHGQSIVLLSR